MKENALSFAETTSGNKNQLLTMNNPSITKMSSGEYYCIKLNVLLRPIRNAVKASNHWK